MTDRSALLDAIRAHPKEDAPRLAYADWIEEYLPDDPVTPPTAEFIRLSCKGRVSPVMPQAAYRWLDANWHRLVPALIERLHTPPKPGIVVPIRGHKSAIATPENRGLFAIRRGRDVYCRLNTRGKLDRPRAELTHYAPVRLTFWKGFCVSFGTLGLWAVTSIRSAVTSQQPLAVEVLF